MHLFIDIIIEWVLSHYYYYDSGIVETALGNLNEGTQDYYFPLGGGGGGGGGEPHHITLQGEVQEEEVPSPAQSMKIYHHCRFPRYMPHSHHFIL